MSTFYDEWLLEQERVRRTIATSPGVARHRDVPWVRTRQDAQAKVLISAAQGFPTMGGVLVKAEIPPGWHTGRHRHGEESLHVLFGEGFSIIEGQRFDWHTGTTLQIPYRAEHQHFNTGRGPVQYLSALCQPLEAFVHLATLEHYEDCGPNAPDFMSRVPEHRSDYLESPTGSRKRVRLTMEDAPEDPGDEPSAKLAANLNQHYYTKYLVMARNDFDPRTVAFTHLFEEPPGYHGGRHKHLEALVYALEGEGYSDVNGVVHKWEAGDVLHVPPAMYEHEHYNDTRFTQRMLRIQFNIRRWFQEAWPEGYTPQRCLDEQGNPIIAGRIERVRERTR